MERVLNLLRSRLRLNEGEDIEVEFSDTENERLKLSKFFVVGKVLTRKKFRHTIVIGVIKELWKPKVAVEAMAIGEDWEAIGRVVKVDCDAYEGCVGEFLRLRVRIDVTLPLKYGLKVRTQYGTWLKVGQPTLGSVRGSRLVHFGLEEGDFRG
ncbi:hypothetical protein PS2_008472 [Malus domestica]